MVDILIRGGITFTLPLTLLGFLVAILAIRSIMLLASGRPGDAAAPLNVLIHAGIFSFVLSLLGHAISLYQMITAIEGAGGVAPAVVVGGLRVSLIVPLFGLSILTASFLVWMVLRYWRDRAETAAA